MRRKEKKKLATRTQTNAQSNNFYYFPQVPGSKL